MDNDIIDRFETATKLAAAAKRGLTQIPTMDAQALLAILTAEPVKPINTVITNSPIGVNGVLKVGTCPACGKFHLNNADNKYCGGCGRAVIWGD